MAQLNSKPAKLKTHEGATAKHIGPEAALRRSVMSCLLWEREFYEDGQTIAQRILDLVPQVKPEVVAAMAVEARQSMKLRHAPLLLVAGLSKCSRLDHKLVPQVVQRADELCELPAIACHINGIPQNQFKRALGHQMKQGLAAAFGKFDEYQLAKYDRDREIKLRDVLRLVHPKPVSKDQSELWKRLTKGELKKPDTWETALSGGGDKRAEFERLIQSHKLGYMALLRNLRGMLAAEVDVSLIRQALLDRRGAQRVLPFRFVSAARHAPRLEPELDQALLASLEVQPKLTGTTLVLVDVSISMDQPLSTHGRGASDISRMDAAATLASMVQGDDVRVFSFSSGGARFMGDRPQAPIAREVPPRKGMAGVEAITNSQRRGGTLMGQAISEMNAIDADRLIVITDEQSQDRVPDPVHGRAYMINVASNRNGVGYGKWTHVDGFSESVLTYIIESEKLLD